MFCQPKLPEKNNSTFTQFKSFKQFIRLRYWVGIHQGLGATLTSCGQGASLALVGNPSNDGITIKIPCGVDVSYIDQPHTPSFPIGLVKTKSDYNVGSVQTGSG